MRLKRVLLLIPLMIFVLACGGVGAATRQIGEEPIKGTLPHSAIAGTWTVGELVYMTVIFNNDGTYEMSGKCNGMGKWDVEDGKFIFPPSPCKWAGGGWYVAKTGDAYVIYGGTDEEDPDNYPYWDKVGPPKK